MGLPPSARDLQAILVFSQHPAWFIAIGGHCYKVESLRKFICVPGLTRLELATSLDFTDLKPTLLLAETIV